MRPSEEKKKRAAKLAYLWCCKHLKKSKYHCTVPKLNIRSAKKSDLRGYYKERKNLIVVFTKNHDSILDICRTILHEWKHYQQNVLLMYDRYLTRYGRNVSNHPYEITAEKFAYKHGFECRKWVNSEMKKIDER